MPRLPVVAFPLRLVGLLLALGWSVAAHAQIDPADVLKGSWKMIDQSPALIHPSNEEGFTILRVMAGETQWADGSFYLKWPNEPRPERGYYSMENGRVWITTYRWVDQERKRVEYTGVLKVEDRTIIWEGSASTTRGGRTIWSFKAEKL